MPLTPAELAATVAEAFSMPLTTVKNYDRKLMEAGLRTKKGHGRGSALMGPKDVAVLLAAIASCDEVERASECVQMLYAMPYDPILGRTDVAFFQPDVSGAAVPTGLSFLSKLVGVDEDAVSTFGTALVALVEHLMSAHNPNYSLGFEVLIGHGLPFAAGLVILRPNKRANRIDFFTKEVFHFHKTIQTHVLIAKATVGVDALIKALRERDIAESGNGGT
jgi:hypothetical protein